MSRRALLSVHDKTGLIELGQGLVALDFELVASGGTAAALVEAGLPVTPVEAVTGFPEVLGGRVKTLHPAIHAGILARRTPAHLGELADRGLAPIDVVVCNLYPFGRTVAAPGCTEADAIEQIDIGGVTLLRAAAKNFEAVAVVCDPLEYPSVVDDLRADRLDLARRRALALAAFQHTAAYDAAIAEWLAGDDPLPAQITVSARRVEVLRYGENPHQAAALYQTAAEAPFVQHSGDALSYNNLVDLEAAWAMPQGFEAPAVAIIKHTNPCGLAVGADLVAAFDAALASDPVSAYGSIIATNRAVDEAFVEALGKLFVEALVAPAFTDEALAILASRKKRCRVMEARAATPPRRRLTAVTGGFLVQTADTAPSEPGAWRVVTARAPTEAEQADLAFAWQAVRFVKSNAIVFAKGGATVGVGAGQMNRVQSVRLAAWQAGERARGSVLASDAFFPFADGLEAAAAAGVTAAIQPGGSIRDAELIAAADALGLAMVFTGRRHFLH
ncbi:MAG: bifunctional phosphoribosylaminoimidazolecarboxamide formyltransferase/IMP cyclohydrolase [Myxococcales bacterium]|nr:bifunctional phosphoribosylaminoimidazolecarboxamide formyltransferase/IMP cyclohydrolase [Myxococcales bacterium]